MNVIAFRPEHFQRIDLQATQRMALSYVTPEYTMAIAEAGPALTVLSGDKVLGCGGIALMPFGVGMLWAFVDGGAGPHFVAIHRITSRFIDAVKVRRLETAVQDGFQPGCRWVEMLGFQKEGLMRSYGPDGSDFLRYARIR